MDIAKKIGNNHVVWLEKSNRWVQLEEPAWLIYSQRKKGTDTVTLSRICAKRYNLTLQESDQFVNEICTCLSGLNEPARDPASETDITCLPSYNNNKNYSSRDYLIGTKYFRINFETRLAEYYIHPPLAHLETSTSGKTDVKFEIKSSADIPVLIEQNYPAYACKDFMQLKKRLFIRMANTIYNKTNEDWMSFVHASAITDGKQTVLLSSGSGSGKSTMAALLQKKGLSVASDDFVPIDAKKKQAFAFPAAISVKEGSFKLLSPYYGNLHDKDFNSYEFINSKVRFLPPKSDTIQEFLPQPLKCIVFIKYNPNIFCNFNIIPQNEALKLFHEQAWVSGNPKHARNFINWFVKLDCYRLEYGDTDAGINKILRIFKN